MTKFLLSTSKLKQFIFIYATNNNKKKFLHKQQSLLSRRALPLDLLPPFTFLTLGNTSCSTPSTLKLLSSASPEY